MTYRSCIARIATCSTGSRSASKFETSTGAEDSPMLHGQTEVPIVQHKKLQKIWFGCSEYSGGRYSKFVYAMLLGYLRHQPAPSFAVFVTRVHSAFSSFRFVHDIRSPNVRISLAAEATFGICRLYSICTTCFAMFGSRCWLWCKLLGLSFTPLGRSFVVTSCVTAPLCETAGGGDVCQDRPPCPPKSLPSSSLKEIVQSGKKHIKHSQNRFSYLKDMAIPLKGHDFPVPKEDDRDATTAPT